MPSSRRCKSQPERTSAKLDLDVEAPRLNIASDGNRVPSCKSAGTMQALYSASTLGLLHVVLQNGQNIAGRVRINHHSLTMSLTVL